MTYELSPEAAVDLVHLLQESRLRWGTVVARRTRERLERRFEAIAARRTAGHRRIDIPAELPLLFETETPFVIAFHAETLQIVRVVHGHRDLPRLFPPRSAPISGENR